MKAIIKSAPGRAALVTNAPIPKVRDGYILVKTVAIALNPTDWKHIDYISENCVIIGVDYAGVVIEVGRGVTKNFKQNDRICGFVHGGNDSQHEDGSHAEFIVVKGDVQMHIPECLSFEQAASIGSAIVTCGQALYQTMEIPLPFTSKPATGMILIYGGSTATGALGIQFAKMSGFTVLTTCSPQNNAYCKELGAHKIFDYSDLDCGQLIRSYSEDKLTIAWDCISSAASCKICEESISSNGGSYGSLMNVKLSRTDIKYHYTLAYTVFGEKFYKLGRDWPAKEEDFEFCKSFTKFSEALVAQGKLKPHRIEIGEGGLRGALDGIDQLRNGKVSGLKLVYRVAETS